MARGCYFNLVRLFGLQGNDHSSVAAAGSSRATAMRNHEEVEEGGQNELTASLQSMKAMFVRDNPEYGYGHLFEDGEMILTSSTYSHQQSTQIFNKQAPFLRSSKTHDSNDDAHNQHHSRRLLVDAIRERDFPHLLQQQKQPRKQERHNDVGHDERGLNRRAGVVYLDHAGATLYSASQLRETMRSLLCTVHGNPHSQVCCEYTVRAQYSATYTDSRGTSGEHSPTMYRYSSGVATSGVITEFGGS